MAISRESRPLCREKGLSGVSGLVCRCSNRGKTSRETDTPGRSRQNPTVMVSLFSNVTDAPPIEVLEMKRRHDEDDSPCKINLTVGGYKVS